jgi:hypothetical protein
VAHRSNQDAVYVLNGQFMSGSLWLRQLAEYVGAQAA